MANKYSTQENQVENVFTRHSIDKNIIVDDLGIEYDYNALIDLVDRWHTVFEENKLVKGDRVAVAETQTAVHIALFIAIAEYGLEYFALPIAYFQGNDPRFDHKTSGIKMVFLGEKIAQIYWWTLPKYYIKDLDTVSPKQNVVINVTGDDVILRGQTAGTTGNPRIYSYPHSSLLHSSTVSKDLFYKSTDRVLMYTSVNHVGMITMQFMPTLLAGCRIVIHRKVVDIEMLFLIEHKNINKTIMMPPTVEALKKDPRWETYKFDTLEEVLAGGNVLSMDFVQALFDKGIKQVNNVYGLTEALPPVFFAKVTPDNIKSMYTDGAPHMGVVVPGWEVKLSDDNAIKLKGIGRAVMAASELDEEGFYTAGDTAKYVNGEYIYNKRAERYGRIDGVLTNLYLVEQMLMNNFPLEYVKAFEEEEKLIIECQPLKGNTEEDITKLIKIKFWQANVRFSNREVTDRIK